MTRDEALAPLRLVGMRAIAGFLLANALLVLPIGWLIGSGDSGLAALLGMLGAAIPLWNCLKGRIDAQARLCSGIALALCPMIYVYLFRSHPWQMDMHMYFFVCFSMMVLLCDIKPLLLSAAITVLHHLGFHLWLPDWVFPGSGSVGRVLLHGFLVACEVAIIATAVELISRRAVTNVQARADANRALERAEEALIQTDIARARAEQALASSRAAEARAEREHAERVAAEAALQELSDERRRMTADQIEANIGALVTDLQSVTENIGRQAEDISAVSAALADQAQGLSASSASAVSSIEGMASNSDALRASIDSVGHNARSARRVADETAASIATLEPGIQILTREVDAARVILSMVSEIASQSNLLALNAAIEAARSGEAGRGFSVVAGEMKQMANATDRAAGEIGIKLAGIVQAADAFRELIATSTAHADEIKASSGAIFDAVARQETATLAITDGAERMLAKAVDTDQRSKALTQVAARNSLIASDAEVLAHQLGERAEQLRARMGGLLADLRAA